MQLHMNQDPMALFLMQTINISLHMQMIDLLKFLILKI